LGWPFETGHETSIDKALPFTSFVGVHDSDSVQSRGCIDQKLLARVFIGDDVAEF